MLVSSTGSFRVSHEKKTRPTVGLKKHCSSLTKKKKNKLRLFTVVLTLPVSTSTSPHLFLLQD